jgi:hypothetical protein
MPSGNQDAGQPPDVTPPRAASPAVPVPLAGVPAELSGMLLPTEHVTFASGPHPITLLHPVVSALIIAFVFSVALAWQQHPIVHGHHVTVPLIGGRLRMLTLFILAVLLLREALLFLMRLIHYFSYRIVTTNRRVFVVEGLVGRRVRPFGNTALASSRLVQGPLGRALGYGTIIVGGEAVTMMAGGALRDLRDPVHLYHEFEAVAMGVDGDNWAQPVRQTIVP